MQVQRLDHVNIRTAKLDTLTEWYVDVLGLRVGDRPNFPFPGAWLYAGDQAVVHLVEVSEEEAAAAAGEGASLQLEHFSFRASGLAQFEAKLAERGLASRRSELAEACLVLINVRDPDGNRLHIDFPLDESA